MTSNDRTTRSSYKVKSAANPRTNGSAATAGLAHDRTATRGKRPEAGHGEHEHRTAKIIELVCSSSKSFEAAIKNGLEDARQTTRGITGCDIQNMSVQCDNGNIVAYKVNMKLSFGVERGTQE